MKIIGISEAYENLDERIIIKFIGVTLKKGTNEREVKRKIKDFIINCKYDNILENITVLRTILSDYKEKYFKVSFCNKTQSIIVIYDNMNDVKGFYYAKKVKDSYEISYDSFLGLKLNYCSESCIVQKCIEDLNVIKKNILDLSNLNPIILDNNDKVLIEIYKLFYKENPDFRSDDINIKIQTMMSILSAFNVSLNCNYSFSLINDFEFPFSLTLENMIQRMCSLGPSSEVKDNVKLNGEYKKIIEVVGDSIRDSISDEDNLNDILITISRVIYASRDNLLSKTDISEIAEFVNRSVDDVEASVQLVKQIKHKINKDN